MTFVISGKILVDGQQAKFELAATAAEILKLRGGQKALAEAAAQGTTALQAQINTLTGVRAGFSSAASSAAAFTEALDARDEFNALRASVDPLFASSQRLAQAQEIVARAIEKGGIEASQAAALLDMYEAQLVGVQMSSGAASGAVGNMAAQFNDVFVMMAAGQNPMQLAIQQGTQITQAFGNAGAAGALRLLRDGFLTMLSPMNVLFIAGLAGAAALGQALMDVGEEAVTLDGAIDDLSQSIEEYQGFVRLAATDTAELREQFGQFAGQVQGFAEYMAGVQLATTMDELRASITPLKGELADVERAMRDVAMAREAVDSAQSQLDAGFGNPEQLLRAQEALALFQDNAEGLAASLGLTVDQAAQLAFMLDSLGEAQSMADIATQAGAALAFIEQMVPAGSDLPAALRPAVTALEEMQRKAAEAATETDRLAQEAGRAAGETERLAGAAPGSGWMSTAIGETNALISRLIAANQAMDALRAGGGMASGPGPAPSVPSGLGIGLDTIYGNVPPALGGAVPMESSRRPQERPIDFLPGDGVRGTSGTGSGSGRAAATRAETSAVERLIERRTEELELLRETDPVSREMIRNRELLATATEAQRAQIEEVTAALEREKAVQAASDFFSNSAADFLRDMRRSAGDASEAIDNLINKLIDAGIQALMLGEGPLAGLFGTKGTSVLGSLFGGIFGGGGGGGISFGRAAGVGGVGLPKRFADGGEIAERTGMIYGEGGPRDDKELILASPGEFIVNGRATARHRDLLEALNSGGDLPRFANGGVVGLRSDRTFDPAEAGNAGAAGLGGEGLRIDVSIPVSIDARGSERGVEERIEAKLLEVLPGVVKRSVQEAVSKVQDKMGRGALQ